MCRENMQHVEGINYRSMPMREKTSRRIVRYVSGAVGVRSRGRKEYIFRNETKIGTESQIEYI